VFTLYIFDHMSFSFPYNEKYSRQSYRENQNTYFVLSNFFFFSKILPFMIYCGNIPQSGAGHRWQYGACALHAGYL